MNPYIGLFFDVVIVIALIATIFHAVRLSRQFNRMKADQQAFDALISSLNIAAGRAEAAIRSLRDIAGETGENLQDKTAKARAIADELEIMIQAGDNLAERLNKLATDSRRNVAPAAAENRDAPVPRTRAEKELMDALKAKQKS